MLFVLNNNVFLGKLGRYSAVLYIMCMFINVFITVDVGVFTKKLSMCVLAEAKVKLVINKLTFLYCLYTASACA